LLALLALLAPPCADVDSTADTPLAVSLEGYNVVLIVIDTLRADHLGTYGYERPTSPWIDLLAAGGVVFERALSTSSYTRESISALWSGQLSTRSGAVGWNTRLPAGVPNLVRTLGAAGYRTGFVSDQTALRVPKFVPGVGFDEVAHIEGDWTSRLSPLVTDQALHFSAAAGGDKFFLYAHFLDPHASYAPPLYTYLRFGEAPLRGHWTMSRIRKNVVQLIRDEKFGPGHPQFDDFVRRYDAEISHVDESVNNLIGGLRALGVLDQTLIILTSDHGEEFLDHGFVGHAWTLYDEVLHVPLVFWAGERLASSRVSGLASLIDVTPTILDLLGVQFDADAFDGQTLVDRDGPQLSLRSREGPAVSQLLTQERSVLQAVTQGDWKYIVAHKWLRPVERAEAKANRKQISKALRRGELEPVSTSGPPVLRELYNLVEDPLEQDDRYFDGSPIVARLERALDEARARAAGATSKVEVFVEDVTPDDRAKLEALGY
jgi:arylsulfatase A-like enzyme